MTRQQFRFPDYPPLVVGSIGEKKALADATPESLAEGCGIAEIRLDLLHDEFRDYGPAMWRHLLPFPLLFTARCHAEGSPFDLDSATREAMLRAALPDARMIDIEVVSAASMSELISEIAAKGIAWIASYHDFLRLPSEDELVALALLAKASGADAFKVAAKLHTPEELAALARFQMSELGIPLATMGMGDLAPVSRLLCAQAGSVLNYGFIGETATAPGQWSARQLGDSIRFLKPLS